VLDRFITSHASTAAASFALRAQLHFLQDAYEHAYADYRHALALDPTLPSLVVLKAALDHKGSELLSEANLHVLAQQLPTALALLTRAITLNPNDPQRWCVRGAGGRAGGLPFAFVFAFVSVMIYPMFEVFPSVRLLRSVSRLYVSSLFIPLFELVRCAYSFGGCSRFRASSSHIASFFFLHSPSYAHTCNAHPHPHIATHSHPI
jgi:tetratricopeptide (TPR) repeat protein